MVVERSRNAEPVNPVESANEFMTRTLHNIRPDTCHTHYVVSVVAMRTLPRHDLCIASKTGRKHEVMRSERQLLRASGVQDSWPQ
jgi:hypothetical protein